MPAPTQIDFSRIEGGSATSLARNWTDFSGFADDDIIYALIYRETTAAYTATPSGWVQLGSPVSQSTGGFKYELDIWYRRISGDSGAITFSWTGAAWCSARYVIYRGLVTGETPASAATDLETAQNDQPSHAGITVIRSNSGLLFVTFNFTDATDSGDPSGFTQVDTAPLELEVYEDLTVSPGATGVVTLNMVDPEYPASVLLELFTEAAPLTAEALDFRSHPNHVIAEANTPAAAPRL